MCPGVVPSVSNPGSTIVLYTQAIKRQIRSRSKQSFSRGCQKWVLEHRYFFFFSALARGVEGQQVASPRKE
jgi:hypothetical protein